MLPLTDERAEFLRRTQVERDKRELEQRRETAIVKIQSTARTFLVRRQLAQQIRFVLLPSLLLRFLHLASIHARDYCENYTNIAEKGFLQYTCIFHVLHVMI